MDDVNKGVFGSYFLKLFLKIVFENIKNIKEVFSKNSSLLSKNSVFLYFSRKNKLETKHGLSIFLIFLVFKNKTVFTPRILLFYTTYFLILGEVEAFL